VGRLASSSRERTSSHVRHRATAAGLVWVGLLAACGGSDDDATTEAGAAASTGTAPGATAANTASGTAAVPRTDGPNDSTPAAGTARRTTATDATAVPATGGDDVKRGSCTVTVTGDRAESWTFEQSVYSFSTDYWMDEEELRGTVEALGEEIAGGTYEEIVGRGEPIVTFLSISCANPDNLIEGAVVTHTNATHASDLPMGPGNYPISGGLLDAAGPAGTMTADFSVSNEELYQTVADSGTLTIAAWDHNRIEGSFAFTAREAFVDAPREVQVAVTFSFVCEETITGC
jgi:hypothetical protein